MEEDVPDPADEQQSLADQLRIRLPRLDLPDPGPEDGEEKGQGGWEAEP